MFDVQNASSARVQHDASHGDRHALQSFRTFHITHIEACGTYYSNDTITVETMCHLFHACALRMPGVIQQGSTAMEMAKIATWKIHEQRCGPLQNSDWRRLVSANACPVLSIEISTSIQKRSHRVRASIPQPLLGPSLRPDASPSSLRRAQPSACVWTPSREVWSAEKSL